MVVVVVGNEQATRLSRGRMVRQPALRCAALRCEAQRSAARTPASVLLIVRRLLHARLARRDARKARHLDLEDAVQHVLHCREERGEGEGWGFVSSSVSQRVCKATDAHARLGCLPARSPQPVHATLPHAARQAPAASPALSGVDAPLVTPITSGPSPSQLGVSTSSPCASLCVTCVAGCEGCGCRRLCAVSWVDVGWVMRWYVGVAAMESRGGRASPRRLSAAPAVAASAGRRTHAAHSTRPRPHPRAAPCWPPRRCGPPSPPRTRGCPSAHQSPAGRITG